MRDPGAALTARGVTNRMRVDVNNSMVCKVCASALPSNRRSLCSAECKAVAEKARARSRYLADREAWKAQSRQWKVDNPERARELAREYGVRHRAETRQREADYRRANRARYSQHVRSWYWRDAAHARALGRSNSLIRRARMSEVGVFVVTERDLRRTWNRYAGQCAYCSKTLSSEYDWDHVVPISRGGAHSVGNLVPACIWCNRSKGAKLLSQWRFDLQSLTVL